MTEHQLKKLASEIERVTREFKLLEAELRLLRDWRDTWLNERGRLQADNDKLRQVLAQIADEARKPSLTSC